MRARPRLADESGLSIVEILVAIIILAIGLLAVLGTFDAATRNAYRAEQSQVATNIAQQQLEQIRNLDYDTVAMTTTPAHSSDPASPFFRVSGGNFDLSWDSATQIGSNPGEMDVDYDDGVVNPGGTPWTSGDVSGRIYRFIVWRNDPNCLLVCPGAHDYKRAIVIVTLNTVPASSARSYFEVQSDFSDPNATTLSTSDPTGGPPVTAQQFFLTDTSCREASASVPSGEHLVHNTLGACSGTGANPPDGLFSTAPTDPDPNDPSNPPLYDYATDGPLEPSSDPTSDRGLQMLRQDQNGCTFSGGTSNNQYKVHRWLSQPVPLAFTTTGQATLDFYTRTIDDVNIPGGICVWLFTRTETTDSGTTSFTDTPLVDLSNPPNAYFTFTQNPWPLGAWVRRSLSMSFSPTTLVVGERLGLAIAVRRNDTPQDALEFMYDHPDYPSRLEVKTTTPF